MRNWDYFTLDKRQCWSAGTPRKQVTGYSHFDYMTAGIFTAKNLQPGSFLIPHSSLVQDYNCPLVGFLRVRKVQINCVVVGVDWQLLSIEETIPVRLEANGFIQQ